MMFFLSWMRSLMLILALFAGFQVTAGWAQDDYTRAEDGETPGYAGMAMVSVAPREKNPDYFDALADAAMQKLDWSAACEIYDQALRLFPGHARLQNNAAAARDAWARAALAKNQWETALDACENALARGLMPAHFKKKIAFIVQKAGTVFIVNKNVVQLEAWLGQARSRFSDLPAVKALIPELYAEALEELPLNDDHFYISQGLAYLQSYQSLQDASRPDATLVKAWCDRLLSEYQKQKAWDGALHLLQTARELLPDDAVLRRHEMDFWNARAQAYIQLRQWDFAALVYEQALDRFPREPLFVQNLKYCQWKRNQPVTAVQ